MSYSDVAVAKKLRGALPGMTMSEVALPGSTAPTGRLVFFRSKRNRRRVDVAKKTGELTAAAKEHAPWVLRLLGLIVAFVAIGFGANEGWNYARTSPRFGLSDVKVTGQSEATDVELVRLGGVLLGQNLFAMDPRGMERSIATHPWVKSVRVTRHFPSRLTIEVEEHRAIAALTLGDLYLVNEEGAPFKRLKAGDDFDVPLITGIDRDALANANEQTKRSLLGALELIDAWTRRDGVRDTALSEVNLHPEGMTVVTTTGQQLEFGEGDVPTKLDRLARVQQELRARSMVAEVIRLDNRTRPSWVAVRIKDLGITGNSNSNKATKKP